MCGITGYISKSKTDEKVLKDMLQRIVHRGPDAEGIYIDKHAALGHRRLSIIDLSTGGQPIYNEKKDKLIMFNGEIYNYQEIKKDLVKKKHKFTTTTDTEVILHGYEEYGKDILKKLRGMFAFVIWDIKKQELFGARDHFGIKPLYYYHQNNVFMYGSEIKSFLSHPDFKKELNTDILPAYLRFNYTPTEETFFKNVYKLKPGHYFTYQKGKLEINRYFELTFDVKEKEFDQLVEDISKVMKDSTKKHMISDVEVGSFLSSGIDSSYLVALAKPDKTYTVGYDIPKYDEISYAKDLTDRLHINNTSKKISKEEYFDVIPKLMYHMDEPLADPAAVALYFVAKLASKDVKVVLSGEGADEFFGGYNTYREEVDYRFYNKIPYFIRHTISSICSHLPQRRGLNFLVRRGRKLEDYYIGVNAVYSEKQAKNILNIKDHSKSNKEIIKPVFELQKGQSNIIKRQAIDINFWLMNDIFQKADKMTMANSIEGRVPFTDIEVFKLARTLPDYAKVTKENTKVALRLAAKKDIPNESYNKKKLGFPVPLREWMREEDIYLEIKDTFQKDICQKLFKSEKLLEMLEEHRLHKKDHYKKIWTVYTFLIWYHEFFEKEA